MRSAAFQVTFTLFTILTTAATAPAVANHDQSLHRRDATFLTGSNGDSTSIDAFNDNAHLPLQIGGILGSYAVSLVIVGLILLALNKQRKDRLEGADEVEQWSAKPQFFPAPAPFVGQDSVELGLHPDLSELELQKGHLRNFSLPSPTSRSFRSSRETSLGLGTAPRSLAAPPGVSIQVDQSVVVRDRIMAQDQLEEMYKHVMEQEDAKERGLPFRTPSIPSESVYGETGTAFGSRSTSTLGKKHQMKPSSLNLSAERSPEKAQSKTSSFMSALKSPLIRKKQVSTINISSPIMTPMSSTFPSYLHGEEMAPLSPRHYIPPVPSVPHGHMSSHGPSNAPLSPRRFPSHMAPITPPDDMPESTQSIDERLKAMSMRPSQHETTPEELEKEEEEAREKERREEEAYALRHSSRQEGPPPSSRRGTHTREGSLAQSEAEPVSASSQTPLVGLPTSPKPGARFPSLSSLPTSPKPGATFSRANPPSAVRTGGVLPLRAYEPALMSPNTFDRSVKQTTFERSMPMSPGGMHTARTPGTGMAVPYSPYQPFSPVIPMTPSLVTKADRKRMKKYEPKTPTMQMVSNDDDVW